MSIRQSILDAVGTRLAAITTANGYNTNIGDNVKKWLTRPLSSTEDFILDYRGLRADRDDTGPIGKFRFRLLVEIRVMTRSGAATEADLIKMVQDIYNAVGTDDSWGTLAVYTDQPDYDELQIEQEDQIVGGAVVALPIIYDAPKWDI